MLLKFGRERTKVTVQILWHESVPEATKFCLHRPKIWVHPSVAFGLSRTFLFCLRLRPFCVLWETWRKKTRESSLPRSVGLRCSFISPFSLIYFGYVPGVSDSLLQSRSLHRHFFLPKVLERSERSWKEVLSPLSSHESVRVGQLRHDENTHWFVLPPLVLLLSFRWLSSFRVEGRVTWCCLEGEGGLCCWDETSIDCAEERPWGNCSLLGDGSREDEGPPSIRFALFATCLCSINAISEWPFFSISHCFYPSVFLCEFLSYMYSFTVCLWFSCHFDLLWPFVIFHKSSTGTLDIITTGLPEHARREADTILQKRLFVFYSLYGSFWAEFSLSVNLLLIQAPKFWCNGWPIPFKRGWILCRNPSSPPSLCGV